MTVELSKTFPPSELPEIEGLFENKHFDKYAKYAAFRYILLLVFLKKPLFMGFLCQQI